MFSEESWESRTIQILILSPHWTVTLQKNDTKELHKRVLSAHISFLQKDVDIIIERIRFEIKELLLSIEPFK